ncbi:MAG: MFS transporter, partial [Anaerolineales bacterium]
MLGAAAGSLSRNLGPHAPGFVAAGLCLANVAAGWFWLAEPPPHEEPAGAPAPAARRSVRRSILEVLRHPLAPVSSLVWIYAVGMMAFFAMNSIFGLYLGNRFGVTENTIGYFFVYIGGLNVVIRAFLLGPAVRRFGEVGALRLGALTLIVGLLVLPLVATLPLLAIAIVFVPVGTALLFPATTALVSRLVPRREVGQALGVQQSFGGVSRMVGPLMAGLAYELGPRYSFWLAAALMAGVSVLTRQVREEPSRKPAVPAEAAAVTEAVAPKGF